MITAFNKTFRLSSHLTQFHLAKDPVGLLPEIWRVPVPYPPVIARPYTRVPAAANKMEIEAKAQEDFSPIKLDLQIHRLWLSLFPQIKPVVGGVNKGNSALESERFPNMFYRARKIAEDMKSLNSRLNEYAKKLETLGSLVEGKSTISNLIVAPVWISLVWRWIHGVEFVLIRNDEIVEEE